MHKFIDISYWNTSEYNILTRKYIIHEFDWDKAIAQGVEGALIKANEGEAQDISYDLSMSTCPLPYRTAFAYVNYTKNSYHCGDEIAWGKTQGQKLVTLADKYRHNIRVMVDFEQNAKWEPLANTKSDSVLDRALKIALAMVGEINRLTNYWPILYSNKWNSQFMHNFTMCPLHLAVGSEIKPIHLDLIKDAGSKRVGFYNWYETALVQYHWKGDGKIYGNFTGNPDIDLDSVEDVSKILIPGMSAFSGEPPVTEDVPIPVQLTDAQILAILCNEYRQTHQS